MLPRAEIKCAKIEHYNSFSRVLEIIIMIFSDIGGSRHPLEPVLRIWGIVVILMAHPVRKPVRFLSQNAAIDQFFAACDFYVFLSVFLIGCL